MQNIMATWVIWGNNWDNLSRDDGGYHHIPRNENKWGKDKIPWQGIWNVVGYKEN